MYPMPEFQERDQEAILEFVRKYPLGMVAAVGESGSIAATHIPILTHQSGSRITMRGHVMRKTAHWKALHTASEVLIAFTGPDAPILASWNENLNFGGTWNYMAVHARGKPTFLPEAELVELLRELKDGYEEAPEAKFDLLPPDYVPSLIRAIEGFEIEVTSLEAVFKLSQNRKITDFDRQVESLRKRGGESALVAEEMTLRKPQFFPAP